MGKLISAFVLVSLVGAALAFNTIEHSHEITEQVNRSREFFSNALGLVLPDEYSDILTRSQLLPNSPVEGCLTLEVDTISEVIERINVHHIATHCGTPVSTPDGRQLILLEDPNGILIEVLGS